MDEERFDVKKLRQDLRFSPMKFAALLGVNPSTIYRWEAKQSTGPEGAPLAILYALRALMVTSTGTEQNKLRKWLREHLYVGGLTYVLIKLFKSQGPFQ
jgi:transcriptional regulator with XRE-family HTH domain